MLEDSRYCSRFSRRSLAQGSLRALALTTALAPLACSSSSSATGVPSGSAGTTAVESLMPDAGSAGGSSAGGAGAGGPGASESDAGSAGASATPEIPALLSQAGLYEADMQTLAAGVRPFRPRFELWSDGASKRRWIHLPEGTTIDTTSPQYWSYPPGTRIYKEFAVDGVRVETRLLHRQANGAWWMMAYHWRADQLEADAAPDGLVDASGTAHDIPSTEDCRTCHLRMPDKVIGFSAIELAHESEPEDPAEWTLTRLAAEGRLTQPGEALQVFPDDELGREALGYLHANCGFCHQPRSSVSSRVSLDLWLRTSALATVAETPTYTSTVGVDVDLTIEGPQGFPLLIDPGSPATSALYLRMDIRGPEYQMPPLASQQIDAEATALIGRWIESLASGSVDAGVSAPP